MFAFQGKFPDIREMRGNNFELSFRYIDGKDTQICKKLPHNFCGSLNFVQNILLKCSFSNGLCKLNIFQKGSIRKQNDLSNVL